MLKYPRKKVQAMKIEEVFDVNVCVLKSLEETPKIDPSCDLAEIEGKYPDFGYVRPRKISWRAYLNNQSPYDIIRSKKLRKLMVKWEQEMPVYGLELRVIDPLDKDNFQEWLQIYTKHIGEKEHANFAIDETWLKEKQQNKKDIVGLLMYKHGTLIGGNICTLQKDKLSIGFGIVKHSKNLNWNLGALLDFLTIKFGVEKGYKIVSFGRDTNLYGLHLSAGLFSYKSRLGLTPEPVEKTGWVTTKFLNYDKFTDPIVFVEERNSKLNLQVLFRNEEPIEKEYLPNGIHSIIIQKIK